MSSELYRNIVALLPENAERVLALLYQLEMSLAASRVAVLARDVESLEDCTQQQRLCESQIGALLRESRTLSAESGLPERTPDSHSHLREELLATQARILHASRVQAALLVRAQRSLRMVANYSAGSGSGYAAALRQDNSLCRV